MRNNILVLILTVFIVSFFTVGGCGGGGDGDSDNSAQDNSGMNMEDEMSGEEMPTEEPTEEPTMEGDESEEVSFIEGGNLPEAPQTFFYVDGGTDRQNLDFYGIEGLPNTKDGLRPAIIFIHGGGWIIGSKEDVDPFLFEVAEAVGFHVISINYRLANDDSAPWPAIIQDVNAAIRWIKLNSQMLGVDPDSLIISGPSAGGHLASLAASSSGVADLQGNDNLGPDTSVRAAVIIFGVHNLNTVFSLEALNLFFGLNCEIEEAIGGGIAISLLIDDDCDDEFDLLNPLAGCDQTKMDQASPIFHLDSDDPPMMLIHGTDDCSVLFLQSEEMLEALSDLGVFNQFILSEGGMHNLESLNLTVDDIVDFLETVFETN